MKTKTPHQQLADALKIAKEAATNGIINSSKLKRSDRERLLKAHCLTEILRGWYLLTSPQASNGGSTAWYGGYWAFIKCYMNERFGPNDYCLSAESSFNLHAGDTTIPNQLIILTKKESNTVIPLIHNTSLLLRTENKNFPTEIDIFNELPVMALPVAISRLNPNYYKNNPQNIEIVLKSSKAIPSDLSRHFLANPTIAAAERLIGAYKAIGEENKSKQIFDDLVSAGFNLGNVNPFDEYVPSLKYSRNLSPHAIRLQMMWESMRIKIIDIFPEKNQVYTDTAKALKIIEKISVQDAYHSLSIEGYQVTEDLINRIENGEWDPENQESDKQQKDVLAAKGYFESFKTVINSIKRILAKENPGNVLSDDLQKWYRELFSPLVRANLFQPERLAGYRNARVYITNSRHIPPPPHAVIDCMETFFQLITNEENAYARAVLGHFVFVYIHPYMDGNGRMARFILNLMLISGGHNWTVIKTEHRAKYMAALEEASTNANIEPFALFIKESMKQWEKESYNTH